MLTPDQLAHIADSMVEMYSQLNETIIRDVARRIAKTATVTETGKLQLRALQNIGTLHQDVISSIAKYNHMSEDELKKLFADAAESAVEYDSKIYRDNGLDPLPINLSPSAMQILKAGYNKTQGNIANLTRTTAVSTQTKFIEACTLAEMKAESGAFTPEQAIFDAVKELALEGATVIYPSGHEDKIDVAVRRNVMTGIGQTTGEICLSYANELGCDLMEITAHAGARPSHAAWQGKIVSLSGRDGYLSLDDIGYGTGAGFKGWNCRHDWYPYFEGSKRMYSDDDLAALEEKNVEFPDGSMHTLYEAEQYQRGLERKIRKTKRVLVAKNDLLKNCTDDLNREELQWYFERYSVNLKSQEAHLRAFCQKVNLPVESARTRSVYFNKSISQKAVGASNRHYRDFALQHNISDIKTLADYYKVKYNDTERYDLLRKYAKSIDQGMLSPLVGFEKYEKYYYRVQNELIGLTTKDGLTIQSQSDHFLERVFGTKADPQHDNKPRSGITLENAKDALLHSKRYPHYTKDEAGNRTLDPTSVSFRNEKCSVSVNPLTGNLINANPL